MNIFSVFLLAVMTLIPSSSAVLKNSVCGQTPCKSGLCKAYIPCWSYRADERQCVFFIYGGCGGNANRFDSKDQCEEMCKPLVKSKGCSRKRIISVPVDKECE